ncbi:unnamed protein product [Urochloa humidicola]
MRRTRGLKRARVEAPMELVRQPMPEVTLQDATPDPRPKKTTLDSLRFLVTMKRELAAAEMMVKYHGFIAALRAFKAGRMDVAGLATYVKALLSGHPELIRGFSEFLPWDYVRSQGPAAGGSDI